VSLASRLESLREAALLDIEKLEDDALLGKNLEQLAARIAERHYLEVPRLHRAVITVPQAAHLRGPGEPGQEHAMVVAPATRVELWLLLEGFATLALLAQTGDLDLGEAQINPVEQCLTVTYLAEHPVAAVANDFFQRSLSETEEKVARIREQVMAYNESLLPAVSEALRAARSRAKERRSFAASLTVPLPKEPWERI
jgi:hypothetical protein